VFVLLYEFSLSFSQVFISGFQTHLAIQSEFFYVSDFATLFNVGCFPFLSAGIRFSIVCVAADAGGVPVRRLVRGDPFVLRRLRCLFRAYWL